MNRKTHQPDTTLIYNGSCPICSREVAMYRDSAARHHVPIEFADLNATDLSKWDLTPDMAARRLYLAKGDQLLDGYDATLALWGALPRARLLARFAGLPGIRQIGTAIYDYLAAPALYALHRRREAKKARSA